MLRPHSGEVGSRCLRIREGPGNLPSRSEPLSKHLCNSQTPSGCGSRPVAMKMPVWRSRAGSRVGPKAAVSESAVGRADLQPEPALHPQPHIYYSLQTVETSPAFHLSPPTTPQLFLQGAAVRGAAGPRVQSPPGFRRERHFIFNLHTRLTSLPPQD